MAGSATITLGISGDLESSTFSFTPSSSITIAGTKKSDLIQDIDNVAGAALSVGTCSTVGLIVGQVLTGTAGATVSFYLDAGFTELLAGAVPQGDIAFVAYKPGGSIYAKASAGTVSVRVLAIEQ